MSVSSSRVRMICLMRSYGFMPPRSSRLRYEPLPREMILPPLCLTQSLYSPAQSIMRALLFHTNAARRRKVLMKYDFPEPEIPTIAMCGFATFSNDQ